MTAWALLFFAIGGIGTWLARAYALRRNLLDHPGERRSHLTSTPRGGGIAVVVAVLVAAIALALRSPAAAGVLVGFAVPLVLVAGIGWWDDHRPLPAWLRLVVHGVAAAMLAFVVFGAYQEPWLAIAAFLAAVTLTNVWNFMDGIDGLACSQAALVAGFFASALSGSVWGWLALAVAAACMGFLPFNFPVARIFLGDVGSGAIGFVIAALAVAAVGSHRVPWSLALLPPSAFLIDAGCTLARRAMRGERWWTAHSQHAYQAWARRQDSHVRVTLAYAAWTVLGIILTGAMRDSAGFFIFAAVLAWYTSGTFLWWRLQGCGTGTREGNREWRKE